MNNVNLQHPLAGKTALITGSTSGIGKALAVQLGKCGVNVVINGTSEAKLQAAVQELLAMEINAVGIRADVTSDEDCMKMAQLAIGQFGCLDFVVANAGLSAQASFEQASTDLYRKMFDVNVIGVITTVKHCLPHLAISKGCVLITGSAIGFGGMPGFSAYAASKMALTALQQSLQIELAPKDIHVGIAYVGITENDTGKTSMAHDGSRTAPTGQQARKGRMATQEEVAKQMLRMLERREGTRVFSLLGHLNCWINRLAPGLARIILARHYHRSLQEANLSQQPAVV